MSPIPDTRISLILRLAAAEDVEAWREFAAIYAPAVFALARSRGLQAADAEDLIQELLLAVARMASRWQPDPERARFRTWLFRVARNLLADHFARRQLVAVSVVDDNVLATEAQGVSQSLHVQHQQELDEAYQFEIRRAIFHRASERVRARISQTTWEAFQATAIEDAPIATVSLRLGISIGSIYVARSRVMKLLRQEVDRLENANADPAQPSSISRYTGSSA